MVSCNNICTQEDFPIFIFYYCKLCSLCVTCNMTCTSRVQAGSSVFSDANVYFRWPILAFFPPERQSEREIRRYDSSSFSKFTNVMFIEFDIWCFGYEKHKITTSKQRSIKVLCQEPSLKGIRIWRVSLWRSLGVVLLPLTADFMKKQNHVTKLLMHHTQRQKRLKFNDLMFL